MTYTHRFERDEDRSAPSKPDHGLIAVKVRLNDDHLVPGVDVAEDSCEERLVGAVSHQDLLHGIQVLGSVEQLGVKLGQSSH